MTAPIEPRRRRRWRVVLGFAIVAVAVALGVGAERLPELWELFLGPAIIPAASDCYVSLSCLFDRQELIDNIGAALRVVGWGLTIVTAVFGVTVSEIFLASGEGVAEAVVDDED